MANRQQTNNPFYSLYGNPDYKTYLSHAKIDAADFSAKGRDQDKLARKRRQKRSPEEAKMHNRSYYIEKRHGVSPEQYNTMIEIQENKCACRGEDLSKFPYKHIHVDHDHETGLARGILCRNCNLAIGNLMDNSKIAQKAVDYLHKFGK